MSPRDNLHGIAMYKLAAKDGKGAWFARRSLHRGVDVRFEKWYVAFIFFFFFSFSDIV